MKFRITPSRLFLALSGALAAVSVVGSWIGNHYLNVPVSEVLSANAVEGCNRATAEGIGHHCFLDYYDGAITNVYPPVARWVFQPFLVLERISGSAQLGLYVWLTICSIALLTPVWWATRYEFKLRWPLIVLTVSSSAFAGPLDRGNSVALTVPLLLLFSIGVLRNMSCATTVGFVGAAIVKPQFALLLLVPLVLRRWKPLGLSALLLVVAQVLGFVVGKGDSISQMRQFLEVNLSRSTEAMVYDTSNISFSQTIHEVFRLSGRFLGVESRLTDFEQQYRFELSLVVLVAIVVSMAIHARRGNIALVTISGLLISSTWVGMSYYYYQSFAVVVAALLLRDPRKPATRCGVMDERPGVPLRLSALLIVVATSNSMFNLPIDASVFGWYLGDSASVSEVTSVSRTLTTPLWLLATGVSMFGWRRRSAAVA